MKRLSRLLVIVGVVGVAVLVVVRAMRRGAPSYEMEEPVWEPPEPHPEPLQPAVVEPEAPIAVPEAVDAPTALQPAIPDEKPEGERSQAELEESEPGLGSEPHMAALEGDVRFDTDAPEAGGTVEVSPTPPMEAEVGAEPHMAALETEHVEAEALPEEEAARFEEETPAEEAVEAEPEAAVASELETGEYTSPEVAAFEAAASVAAVEAVRTEAFAGAPEEAPAAEAPVSQDPNFLTRYFDELAATPEEAEAPASDVGLLESVEEALTTLSPVQINPAPRRNAESYLDEGNVYFNVGQYGLAIERYTQAIELDRGLTAAYYNRANARTRAGEFEGALQDYDRALELQPHDADALNNRGMLHLYRANYAEALRDFNGALAADPSDTTVMVNRGLAHLHGGDPASALVDFREAATMDPADAAAHYGAAQASASLENREEALRHIGLALQYDPGYAREAAGDPRLSILQGDETFLRLLRESGSRST